MKAWIKEIENNCTTRFLKSGMKAMIKGYAL